MSKYFKTYGSKYIQRQCTESHKDERNRTIKMKTCFLASMSTRPNLEPLKFYQHILKDMYGRVLGPDTYFFYFVCYLGISTSIKHESGRAQMKMFIYIIKAR